MSISGEEWYIYEEEDDDVELALIEWIWFLIGCCTVIGMVVITGLVVYGGL